MLALTLFSGYKAFASGYIADDNLIDELFAEAKETALPSLNDFTFSINSDVSVSAVDKSAPVALLLDFFLGGFGVHRFYLGTELMTGCAYPLTCGGFFGVVPIIDFVILIINIEDISQFIDNPKFFMW
jgi:TM2 domain-containing membrane protein YozV